jgi:hypothetical protein
MTVTSGRDKNRTRGTEPPSALIPDAMRKSIAQMPA